MTAMSPAHKEKLRKERVFLVETLTDIKGVLDHLYSNKVLQERIYKKLKRFPEEEGTSELLDVLPMRGPNAFQGFVDALVHAEESECANRLQPGVCPQKAEGGGATSNAPVQECPEPTLPDGSGGATSSPPAQECPEPTLPDEWPSSGEEKKLILCQVHPANLEKMKKLMLDPLVYPFGERCRGICFIINNEDFSMARTTGKQLQDRSGTMKDCEGVNKLFMGLSFETNIKKDLQAKEMKTCLENLSKKNHSAKNCLVVVILSHGVRDHVLGVDGEKVPISYIESIFDDKNSPSLADKPKLIIIQACQISEEDMGVATEATSGQDEDDVRATRTAMSSLTISGQPGVASDTPKEAKKEEPLKRHICVINSTTPGNKAWRNEVDGSRFIQALLLVFNTHAYYFDLGRMLTRVHHLMDKAGKSLGNLLASMYESCLPKDLYFFPGLRLVNGKVEEFDPDSQG